MRLLQTTSPMPMRLPERHLLNAPATGAFLPVLLVLLAAWPVVAAEDGVEFFEKRIRPLLTEACLDCHGPEKQKGGLRLDSREGWATGGDNGPALVPGKPAESHLVKAVQYQNPKLQMPPKRKLAPEQIALLEQWVAMGAPDPRQGKVAHQRQVGLSIAEGKQFWSFKPIQKPAVPTVKDTSWSRNDIDRFILAAQESKGLAPAKDADRAALIRRVYFTLVGLPPTPEQIDAFVRDSRPDAFERVVDSLLSSPHYGEYWGRHWLDVARFAESSGGGRTLLFKDAWRFRDYVIESFNADVPFDRFIREQLAGDLLPAKSPEARTRNIIATAFLALGPTNYEEQDKKQLRFDVIDEQIDTMGKAFLGMTLGCARCHDHKFDPVPTADYYALAGIFASTRTLFNYTDNVARWLDTPLPMSGTDETATLESHAEDLDKRVKTIRAQLARLANVGNGKEGTEPGRPVAPENFAGIVLDDTDAKAVGVWKVSQFSKSYIGEGYRQDQNDGKGEKTLTFVPPIPETGRYEVRLAYSPLGNRATNVPVTVFHADGENQIIVNQQEPPPVGGRFVSLGQYRFEKDGAGYVLISNEGTQGHVLADAVQFLPVGELGNEQPITANPDADNPRIAALEKEAKALERELKETRGKLDKRPLAMSVREEDEIGDTEIRVRGVVHNLGPKVPRGFLQVAMSKQSSAIPASESGRRELAEWIASPENPLTARVMANRVWTWLFGNGLVRSTDNFGTTGELPTHPELLDHLAVRLVLHDWSVKKLVREIVLSRTWQMASGSVSESDPDNRLLTSFPRRRLDAEQLRDAILAVSGQMDLQLGGPNIKGAGSINANTTAAQNTEYTFVFADTRRSVYTPAFRARRLELFEVFDFGNINQTIGQRHVSTVALQALYLMNNPFVIEQSQRAAERLLGDDGASDSARVQRAYQLALGRTPTNAEEKLALQFVRDSKNANPVQTWAPVFQSLFGSLDFRYLD